MVFPSGWIFGKKIFPAKGEGFGWFLDIHPAIVQTSPGGWNILNAAALGFALGIMKNRRVAEIEEYIPHEKMYQKDSPKETQVIFYKILRVFFWTCTGCLSIFWLSWLLSTQKDDLVLTKKKMTQHSLRRKTAAAEFENLMAFQDILKWAADKIAPWFPSCPQNTLFWKGYIPPWQKGYQLGFFDPFLPHSWRTFFLVPQKKLVICFCLWKIG